MRGGIGKTCETEKTGERDYLYVHFIFLKGGQNPVTSSENIVSEGAGGSQGGDVDEKRKSEPSKSPASCDGRDRRKRRPVSLLVH